MIEWFAWGYLKLTLLGLAVNKLEIPKYNRIIHGVFGIFVLQGRDVMGACDYAKERGGVGHDRNKV